jgi:alpha-tubulin suppressor-like RCC1 family protein
MKKEIFSFGKSERGRLGHDYSNVDTIEVLKNEEIIKCTGGGNHSLFLTSNFHFL